MLKVGIYRTVYPFASESFIHEQISNYCRYEPIIIMRSKIKNIHFKYITISENDKYKIKQILFSLIGNPILFNRKQEFRKLSLIHAHFGPDGIYAMKIAEKYGIPFIVTIHGGDITVNKWNMIKTLKPSLTRYVTLKNRLIERSFAFIAISKFIKKRLIADCYPENKIIEHYIGVDVNRFKPIKYKKKERYILCVGRHTEKKGIETLIKSFDKIAGKNPGVSLIQVGYGTMTKKLINLVELLGLNGRVRFLGALPHENVLRLMQGAEIFALTSQTAKNGDSEGLGIVFNEASACGIPIVSTWHGGIPEAVLDGETGLLSPERDEAAIAEKLDRLLSEKGLREKLGIRGREYVCDVFDIRKQTAKLETIYDDILSVK